MAATYHPRSPVSRPQARHRLLTNPQNKTRRLEKTFRLHPISPSLHFRPSRRSGPPPFVPTFPKAKPSAVQQSVASPPPPRPPCNLKFNPSAIECERFGFDHVKFNSSGKESNSLSIEALELLGLELYTARRCRHRSVAILNGGCKFARGETIERAARLQGLA